MKQRITFFLLTLWIGSILPILSQIPDKYYDSTFGEKKDALKTAMKEVIVDHTTLSYGELWTAFISTDNKGNNVVWDMYSDGNTKGYTYHYTGDQCGNYSGEGSCYNREHSLPKSWFNDASPMYTDLFHLYPTDGYVNGMRSNHPFGEVGSANWTSSNGSKRGNCSYPGYSGTVFEPIDLYKGDFARTYFYMITCYEDRISSWDSDMLDGKKYPGFSTWAINMLLKWSRQDPVSQKEIDRNNAVYKIQGNRNPYIDYPQLAEYVWGDSINYTFDPTTNPNIPVTDIMLDYTALVLYVGDTEPIEAIISPGNATNKNIAWTSDDPNIASIRNDGLVTALEEGTTTITATTEDGGKTATCEVTVLPIYIPNPDLLVDFSGPWNQMPEGFTSNSSDYYDDYSALGLNESGKYLIVTFDGAPDKLSFDMQQRNNWTSDNNYILVFESRTTNFDEPITEYNRSFFEGEATKNTGSIQLSETSRSVKISYDREDNESAAIDHIIITKKQGNTLDNPAKEIPFIYIADAQAHINNASTGTLIRVYNAMGQLIKQSTVESASHSIGLGSDKFYIILLSSGEEGLIHSYKIINK